MAKKQFDDVSCRYGAPMGRAEYGHPADAEGKIALFRVVLNQGYDDGGAYWGCATSYRDQLYCARDDGGNYRHFIRASCRDEARHMLCLENPQLKRRALTVEEMRHACGIL